MYMFFFDYMYDGDYLCIFICGTSVIINEPDALEILCDVHGYFGRHSLTKSDSGVFIKECWTSNTSRWRRFDHDHVYGEFSNY